MFTYVLWDGNTECILAAFTDESKLKEFLKEMREKTDILYDYTRVLLNPDFTDIFKEELSKNWVFK